MRGKIERRDLREMERYKKGIEKRIGRKRLCVCVRERERERERVREREREREGDEVLTEAVSVGKFF